MRVGQLDALMLMKASTVSKENVVKRRYGGQALAVRRYETKAAGIRNKSEIHCQSMAIQTMRNIL